MYRDVGLAWHGKTTEIRRLEDLAKADGAHTDFIALGRLADTAELESAIRKSPGREIWRLGGRWAVHLDGLDEALIAPDELVATIGETLRSLQTASDDLPITRQAGDPDNFTVRISCRAAEWPRSLGVDLQNLFEDSIDVVQLNELTPHDAELAAQDRGIAVDAWRRAIEELGSEGADALARRPITLRMLISLLADSGEIPRNQAQLYHRGLLELLGEIDRRRRREKRVGRLGVSELMLVAGRIAAVTIFSNTPSILLTARTEPHMVDAVVLADLAGGYEAIAGESFAIDEADIVDVLRSGLFAPVEEGRFVWAHRTFAEYLSADYLVQRRLTTEQLVEILGNAQDPDGKIPPQLHEAAAWVASMRPDLFAAIMKRDPSILLRSDVAAASDAEREQLVESLLMEFDQERLFDTDWTMRRRYAKLAYPGIASVLRGYIRGREHSLFARRVAMHMAEECGELSVSADLIAVALDRTEIVPLRGQAVIAACDLAGPDLLQKLRPLALPGEAEDHDDELRGWALAALWPGQISFSELLRALTKRRRDNFFGGYWRFRRDLTLDLSPEQAVEAVRWVRDRAPDRGERTDTNEEELIVKLLVAAWRQADDERVIDAFAEFAEDSSHGKFAALLYSARFTPFVTAYADDDERRRQRLAARVLSNLAEGGHSARLSIYGRWPLLLPADMPWLLEALEGGSRDIPKSALVEAIVSLVWVGGIDARDDVWAASVRHDDLKAALAAAFTTSLDSALARHQRDARRERDDTARPAINLLEIVEERLSRAAEHPEEWWGYNLLFVVDEPSGAMLDELAMDLPEQPLWQRLSSDQQTQSIAWAEAYLLQSFGASRHWLRTSTFYRPAAGAYRAFRLLQSDKPERLDDLPDGVWCRWAHVLVAMLGEEDTQNGDTSRNLLARAYLKVPNAVLAALARVLLCRDEQTLAGLTRRIAPLLDDRITDLLWRTAHRHRLSSKRRSEIFRFLLEHGNPATIQALLGDLTAPSPGMGLALDRTSFNELAGQLFAAEPVLMWPKLEQLSDRALARDVYLAAHGPLGYSGLPLVGFTEAQLRALYLWGVQEFPTEAVDDDGGARWMGPNDRVQSTQREILRQLVQRGTLQAVEALRELSEGLPDQIELKWHLAEAKLAFRARVWEAPSPPQLLGQIASYGIAPPLRSEKRALKRAATELQAELRGTSDTSVAKIDLISAPAEVPLTIPDAITPLTLLSVATEWNSAHGGLSTLNRELCLALAAEGHKVACLVLDASDDEREQATDGGVTLIPCPTEAGVDDFARLLLVSVDQVRALGIQVVIGHDHITGPAARHLAKRVLQVPYVHFVHTIPGEIEPFKTTAISEGLQRAAAKAEVQDLQCQQADLVVGVGPRIHNEVAAKLGPSARVTQLRPGLSTTLLALERDVDRLKTINILFQGRLENAELKGAPLAYRATKRMRLSESRSWLRPNLVMRGFEADSFDKQCRLLSEDHGMRDFVRAGLFTTDRRALDTDFQAASLVLMPSRKEGFGLVALEAIAAGIPVILSSESGAAYMLQLDTEVVAAIATDTAATAICDVGREPEVNDEIAWSEQIAEVLKDRKAAFERADKLRKDLAKILSWPRAARELAVQMSELVRPTP